MATPATPQLGIGNTPVVNNVNVASGYTFQIGGTSIFATSNTWTAEQTFSIPLTTIGLSLTAPNNGTTYPMIRLQPGASASSCVQLAWGSGANVSYDLWSDDAGNASGINLESTASFVINSSGNPAGGNTLLSITNSFTGYGTLASYKNTLDDGTGNMTAAGYISAKGLIQKVNAQSANYTATANDYLIWATGGASGITITLPTATGSGHIYVVKKADSGAGAVTVSGTIDGVTSVSLTTQYWGITVMDAASGVWTVISETGLTSPL